MSILKRVVEDQGSRAAALVVAEQESIQQRERARAAIDHIITNKMQRVAATMKENLTVLTNRVVLPKYFVLGDLVVMVELFESSTSDPDPSTPHLAINEFYVSIVGLDIAERVVRRRVGMLSLFSYESVFATLTGEGEPGEFDATIVLKKLDF